VSIPECTCFDEVECGVTDGDVPSDALEPGGRKAMTQTSNVMRMRETRREETHSCRLFTTERLLRLTLNLTEFV